eukprot:c54274_g1_i1 orf=135-1094(-)
MEGHPTYFQLNTGAFIPAIGLGSVNYSCGSSDISAAVLYAIKIGYRHIDTAKFYGTETAIGAALTDAIESGIVKREEMFITSKLWCDDNDPQYVLPALQRSLDALQLDFLDLYLMHWPVKLRRGGSRLPTREDDFLPVNIKGTWRAMESCLDAGLTKAIGVCNFTVKKLTDLLTHAQIPPAVNQVEMHPVWQQGILRNFCNAFNIHVSGWSPLGAPGAFYGTDEVLNHPIVRKIAEKHAKTPAQVALRWGIQTGASVLPKSFYPKRIKENFSIFDWSLQEEDMYSLQTITQRRTNPCEFFCNSSTSPFRTLDDLWDGEI